MISIQPLTPKWNHLVLKMNVSWTRSRQFWKLKMKSLVPYTSLSLYQCWLILSNTAADHANKPLRENRISVQICSSVAPDQSACKPFALQNENWNHKKLSYPLTSASDIQKILGLTKSKGNVDLRKQNFF